ncbi:hypothetical protein HUT16_30415 [Kitasatospora sp. NA04385]|uniref:hypothetical protein n=1 Tax=Kitasatospora sp. NA04385 TaxID=2742135 RepID=UPI0015907828|nr:hypothetical protein [Kitasatospora sp. NA04385]QKW22834.1 hypothetical protein HUT16_30415 [Kitasatospora sp. NA04385]
MAVVAVLGGTGAPGATSSALALLLSWPLRPGRRVLLVECDPDGGAVLAGALEGRVEAVYGLRNLAVADRRGLLAETLWEQLLDVSPQGTGERLLLPGLTDPTQAPGLAYTWEPLVEALRALEPQGYDVLLDLGRSGANGSMAVLPRRADVVAATVRTTLRGLSAARPRIAALREDLDTHGAGSDGLGLLLVTEGPYPENEVARQFQLPVLGALTHAPRTARVLSDGGDTTDRRFIRSELMRTARTAADRIQGVAEARRRRLGGPQPAPQALPPQALPPQQQPQQPQPVQSQPVPPQFVQPPVQQQAQAPAQPQAREQVPPLRPAPVPPQQMAPPQQVQAPQPVPPFTAGPVAGPAYPQQHQHQHQQPYPQQQQQPPPSYPQQPQAYQQQPYPQQQFQPQAPQVAAAGGQFTGEWPIRAEAPQISYAAPYIAPPAVPQPPAPAPFPGQQGQHAQHGQHAQQGQDGSDGEEVRRAR